MGVSKPCYRCPHVRTGPHYRRQRASRAPADRPAARELRRCRSGSVRSRGGDATRRVARKFGWSTIATGMPWRRSPSAARPRSTLPASSRKRPGIVTWMPHEGTARALGGLDSIRRIVYLSVVGATRRFSQCVPSPPRRRRSPCCCRDGARTRVLRVPMVLGESDYASLALGSARVHAL